MSVRRRVAGFTMVEIMVALAIMALVMVGLYATLNTTLRTRELLTHEVRSARLGPGILDTIEEDLRRAWVLNIADDRVFKGESRNLLGESADSLVFLSTVDSTLTGRVGEREVPSDVCETGYRLRTNPAVPDVLELWRRQGFHVDEEPLEDGTYELLHDRVVSFQVRYYATLEDDEDALEAWDAAQRHALPAMLHLRMGLEVGPRAAADSLRPGEAAGRTLWYERMIALADDSALTMRVHPLAPTFTPSGGAGGTAGSGEGEEDGEGEGLEDVETDFEDDGGSDSGTGPELGGTTGGGGDAAGDVLDGWLDDL